MDLVKESPERVASGKPHGKGPVEPGAHGAEREATGSWVEALLVWPNPEDPEGRARFVLDDSTEAYF